MKEKLSHIIDKELIDEIIPFLKNTKEADRKKLTPLIKEKIKFLDQNEKNRTMDKYTILSIAAFVCFTYTDYKRMYLPSYMELGFIRFHTYTQQNIMNKISVDDILEWYCPTWFNKFLNDRNDNFAFNMASYPELIRWQQKGYIKELSPELIANTLFSAPFKYHGKSGTFSKNSDERNGYIDYDVLTMSPITLKEHIWFLFQAPMESAYYIPYYMKDGDNWVAILKWAIENKYISKIELLDAILKASLITDFKQYAMVWLFDIFDELNPTEEEIIGLQTTLYNSLNSKYPRVINTALKCIKSITLHKEFNVDEFRLALPTLMNSTVKLTLKTTIDIVENILKAKIGNANDLCSDLCMGLVTKDATLQKRIATLLVKYGDKKVLNNEISIYSDSILEAVKPLLSDFISVDEMQTTEQFLPDNIEIAKAIWISEERKIPIVETWDDFIFFASQIYEINEPYHWSMFIPYIQKFDKEMTNERVTQFSTILKQAIKKLDTWGGAPSMINRLMANFIICYGKYLVERFPDKKSELEDITNYKKDLTTWKKDNFKAYKLYPLYYLLEEVMKKIEEGTNFEILSTPTHSPLWIDAETLVKRLITNQKNEVKIFTIDFEMALARINMDRVESALALARKELKGEIHDVMEFLLDEKAKFEDYSHQTMSWWRTAYLVKYPYQSPTEKGLGIDDLLEAHFTGEYKFTIKEHVYYGVSIVFSDVLKHLFNKDRDIRFTGEYNHFAISQGNRWNFWDADVPYLIYSYPTNYAPILMTAMQDIGNNTTLDASAVDILRNSLEAVYTLESKFISLHYLFLTTSLYSSSKTISTYATELWIDAIAKGNIDQSILGKQIADVINIEWLPLRRINSMIQERMMNISKHHNRALEEMLNTCIANIEKPVKELKNLIELYSELLYKNKSKPTEEVRNKLIAWSTNSTLKKVCKPLL